MMRLLHSVAGLLVLLTNVVEPSYCPVSSAISETVMTGFLGYPMDIFDQQQMMREFARHPEDAKWRNFTSFLGPISRFRDFFTREVDDPSKKIWLCSSSEERDEFQNKKPEPSFHFCASGTACPIHKQELQLASGRMDQETGGWRASHNLCRIREQLSDKGGARVRVLVLGGSQTAGSGSFGCCCDWRVDPACLELSAKARPLCGNPAHHDVASGCTWHGQLVRWLRASSLNANIVYEVHAEGGCTSPSMVDKFVRLLGRDKLPLTSNDVIFIDHSVNDAITYSFGMGIGSKHPLLELSLGLEALVRLLLGLASGGSALDPPSSGLPTIILLGMFQSPDKDWASKMYGPEDHMRVYAAVAERYKLPLWSYRDAFFVPANASNTSNTSNTYHASSRSDAGREYIQFHHTNKGGGRGHPPWFVNLAHADLVASLLLAELAACSVANATFPSSHARRAGTPLGSIPPPIHEANLQKNHSHVCFNGTDDVLIAMAAHKVFAEGVGNVFAGWSLVQERHDKVGFISVSEELHGANATNVGAGPTRPSLVFSFPFSAAPATSQPLTPRKAVALHLRYLKTYQNAGMVEVLLCGRRVGLVDALWRRFEQERFSAGADFNAELGLDFIERACGEAGAASREGGVAAPAPGQAQAQVATQLAKAGKLELRPLSAQETAVVDADARRSAGNSTAALLLAAARGNLKFKLTHVTLCRF